MSKDLKIDYLYNYPVTVQLAPFETSMTIECSGYITNTKEEWERIACEKALKLIQNRIDLLNNNIKTNSYEFSNKNKLLVYNVKIND